MLHTIITSLLDYVPEILMTIITGIGAFVLSKIKNVINTDTKKAVAKTTVKYVEQVYKDVHGDEKLEIAKANALEILNDKGIKITDLELTVLIESALADLNEVFKETEDKE